MVRKQIMSAVLRRQPCCYGEERARQHFRNTGFGSGCSGTQEKNNCAPPKPPKSLKIQFSYLKARNQPFENGGCDSKLQRAWGEPSVNFKFCLSSRGRCNLSPNCLLKFAGWLFALTLQCLAITTTKVIIHLNVKIACALLIQ